MRKTKLLTSLAALALVLGLGACETTSEEETTSDESGEVTTTDTEETPGGETTGDSNPEGGNPSEGGNDGDSDTVSFSGKFDFTTNGVDEDLASTAMSSATDLDGFWTGDDLYVCCRKYGSIWLGNNQNGAFQSNGLIKVGASGDQGILNFKFAVGVNIEKVVVSAHSWTTNEANNLTINGETLAMPQTGSFEELTYEFEDEYQNILSFNCKSRGFVQYIEVYGTYTNPVEPITELVLSAEETNLNAGSNVEVTVSTVPTTGFDIDTLVWTSNDESVVTVSQNLTGATVHAAGAGSATVTATAENDAKGEITFEVQDVLEESESIVIDGLGYSGTNLDTNTITGHQVSITAAKNTGATAPAWHATMIRVYAQNTLTFTPLYEDKGATITSIVMTYDDPYYGNETATLTDSTGATAGSIVKDTTAKTLTLNITATGAVIYNNYQSSNSGGTQLRVTQFVINYTLAA
ncbi:MAG: Ig-like domain-containing protein [Coprobacillus sp.]|nr:Ig-like domain-containing protein [Coprobacillus sp.]